MLLAELEVWHSRPVTPTRRVALGHLVLPVDPTPGFGGLLLGTGGTPEGVTAAAALKCMGGEIQGLLAPRDEAERQAAIELGYDLAAVLTTDDLVKGNNCFFAATGITDGELLRGVRYERNGARTQSLVMRSKSGTVRM